MVNAVPDRQDINEYARRFIAALSSREVPLPDAGDCTDCFIRVNDGTMGEALQDHRHLESHIGEDYFVPSLLTRAVELFTPGPMASDYMWARMFIASGGQDQIPGCSDRWWEDLDDECGPKLAESLTCYMSWQLGLSGPPVKSSEGDDED